MYQTNNVKYIKIKKNDHGLQRLWDLIVDQYSQVIVRYKGSSS